MFTNIHALPLTAPRNDYLDEDSPDEDETDDPARDPASESPNHLEVAPSPRANKSHAPPQKSMAGWDFILYRQWHGTASGLGGH